MFSPDSVSGVQEWFTAGRVLGRTRDRHRRDEDDGDVSDGKYKRSVRFVAAIVK